MDKRICFVSSRPGFVLNDKSFRMDWANQRLIAFLSHHYKSQFSVALFSDPQNEKKYDSQLEVRHVYSLPFPFSHPGGIRNILKIYATLKKVERQNDILIVQLPIIGFPALLFLRKATVFHICANVLTAVNNPLKYKKSRAIIAKSFGSMIHAVNNTLFNRRNIRVITNGGELAQLYKKANPTKVLSSSLLADDIITDDQRAVKRDSDILQIIFVGRPSLEKGFEILTGSLLQTTVKFKLTVIGFTKDEFRELLPDAYQQSVTIHPFIAFLGYMNWGEEFKTVLRSQDVLIVPSRSEGTPRVILEAMSQGVAIIASRTGGIPDLVTENETGVLFKVDDSADLALKIRTMAEDRAFRKKMILGGLEVAKRNTIEQFAAHFIRNIENVGNE